MVSVSRPLESRPRDSPSSGRRQFTRVLPCLLAAIGLAVVFLLAGLAKFGSISATLAYLQGYALWPDPSTRELGSILPDAPTSASFKLRNVTSRPVTIIGAAPSVAATNEHEIVIDKGKSVEE